MADDISQESFEELNRSIDLHTRGIMSSVLKNAQAQKDQDNIKKKENDARKGVIGSLREMDRNIDGTSERFKQAISSGSGFIRFLNNLSNQGRAFIGLGVFATLSREALGLAESWQKMTEIGNTYGGSMLFMLESAASAGMSMSQFARIQGQYNVMINTTSHRFYDMQKQLRENISAQGSYGMTVEQINELMGSSMEVSRKAGALQHRSSAALVNDMDNLALTTTAVAHASDKARTEIIKLANEANSSAISLAQLRLTNESMRGIVDKNLREATIGFAALPGEAGSFFSKYFSDSFGGMAVLTDQGSAMIEAGLSGLVAEMDSTAAKFRAGTGTIDDQIAYQNRFIDEVDRNLPVLRAQAMAGNQNAAKMIEMRAEMTKTTRAQLEARKAQAANADSLTAFFASFESMFSLLIQDGFVKSFLQSFGDVNSKMENFAKSEAFIAIKDSLSSLGSFLGEFLADTIGNANPEQLKQFLSDAIVGIKDFIHLIIPAAKFFADILSSLTSVISYTVSVFNTLGDIFGTSGGKIAVTLGIIGLVGSKIGGLVSGIRNLLGSAVGTMNVKAAMVNIDGEGGGLGGGRRGRRGRRGGRGGRPRGGAGGRMGGVRSRLGGIGRGIGGLGATLGAGRAVAGGLGGIAGLGLGYVADNHMTQGSLGQQSVSVAGSALTGASMGAMAGSFIPIPGLGTAAGAAIGGGLGALYGLYDEYSKSSAASEAAKKQAAAATPTIEEMASPSTKVRADDPMNELATTMKKNSSEMIDVLQSLGRKMDRSISLLTKLEVNTQSL